MAECQCSICEKPLTGGLDTFGAVNFPVCWDCYWEGDIETRQPWYGLGPHHHDLSITGGIIGSTVMEPVPEPNENGEYRIGNLTFIPDPDVPGLGIWIPRR